ncbi:MAG: DUF262 domain-containing protein [Candidatus Nitrosotenuis sp.]
MSEVFKSEQKRLRLLLEQDYEVPDYQREYSWKHYQVKSFIDDATHVNKSRIKNYFFGPMVFIPHTDKHTVIDGQQRLATVSTFIAVVRDIISEKKLSYNYYQKLLYSNTKSKYRLTLNEINSEFFQTNILEKIKPPKEKIHEMKSIDGLRESDKLILDMYEYFYKRLKSIAKENNGNSQLKKLVKNTLDFFKVISIEAAYENAHLIFETLNERGIPLTKSDLVKNYLIMRGGQDKSKKIHEKWKELTNNTRNKTDDFLKYFCVAHYGETPKDQIYRKIKEKNFTKDDVLKLIEALVKSSKIFAELVEPSSTYWREKEIVTSIKSLNILDSIVFYPLLMLLKEKNIQNRDIRDILKICISLFVRYKTILHKHATKLEKLTIKACEEIRNGSPPKSTIRKLFKSILPNNPEFISAFELHAQKNNAIAKYLLFEIYKNDQRDAVPAETITLEHVVPESVEKQSDLAPSEKDQDVTIWETYVQKNGITLSDIYRLGNMALLLPGDNTEASNKSFNDKKRFIRSHH